MAPHRRNQGASGRIVCHLVKGANSPSKVSACVSAAWRFSISKLGLKVACKSKIRGTLLGVPIIRTIVFWGLIRVS